MSINDYLNEGVIKTNKNIDSSLMRKRNEQMKNYAKKTPEAWEFVQEIIELMDVKDHPLAVYMAFGVIFMDFMGYDLADNNRS